jgi:hypothetical protein
VKQYAKIQYYLRANVEILPLFISRKPHPSRINLYVNTTHKSIEEPEKNRVQHSGIRKTPLGMSYDT